MKKLFALATCAALMSSAVFAANEPAAQTDSKQTEQKEAPKYQLGLYVFDVSTKVPTNLNKTEISRSSKQQLCWIAAGEFKAKNDVVEEFTAPAKMQFNVQPELGVSVASADKKSHIITSKRDGMNEGKNVSSCWSFDKKDPRGKYSIAVKINNISFPSLNFIVVN